MIRALCIIFACLAAGEGIVMLSGIHFPASIVGMGVLFVLLQLGWVKAVWLQSIADVLMQNLSLFLVPPCVAVMNYLDLIRQDFWSITLATVFSTLLVLLVSGKSHEWVRKWR
ncbi:CidA/LrgA family protein [Stenoxybacter acetivorans]|uniref:CidA/LrgA family protein n=1 Tax=Stenoxybacter acetivorans TaxID=422441 RepID=UPI00055FE179|nr:CidA/LrgA family protein [Stenoxybacter acetivorans]